jgi:hypothetical protein
MTRPIEPLDPEERKFYRYDLSGYLRAVGAQIAPGSVVVQLDSASQGLGIQIGSGAYAPQVTATVIAVAFEVAEASRGNPAFSAGHRARVRVTFNTTATPPETLSFDFPLPVRRGCGSAEPTPPPTYTPALNFSDARNSQFVPLVGF